MICEKCGNIITTFEVNFFDKDGSDYWTNVPIEEVPNNAVYIDMGKSWAGDELDEEEQVETIRCPFCRNYPFKSNEVQTYDFVRVVMFKHTAERKEDADS